MTIEKVPCDLCGGTIFSPLFPGTIADYQSNPADYFSSSRRVAGYLPIVRCKTCGLVMTNPRDDAATIQHVYNTLNDPVFDLEDDNRRRTAQKYLRIINKYCPKPSTLLDLGGATGIFACEAQSRGWQVTGLEASTNSIQLAKKRCVDVHWVNSLLEQADFPPNGFQVITLWDVLEHVASPTEVMLLINKWVLPGGWVFLNLPNSSSYIARFSASRWVLLLREHFWYFSPRTIQLLLEKTGFTLIDTRPNFVRFSLNNIATRLQQYRGLIGYIGKYLKKIPLINKANIIFPMGEMNVIAQKTKHCN